MKTKIDIRKLLFEYALISVGIAIAVAGLNLFLVPGKIAAGGVSGIATILYHQLHVPLGVTIAVLNIPLFVLGFRILGRSFVIKTLYGVALYSALAEVIPVLPDSGDLFIGAVFGGVLVGIGIGIVIRMGGTTGGTDMAAKMLSERLRHFGVAALLFAIDFVIIVAAGLVFDPMSALYALVSLYITSKIIDFFTVGLSLSKAFYVISEKSDEIADMILHQMNRGCTAFPARGCFSQTDKNVLLCVLKWRTEGVRLKQLIKQIDPHAFVIVADVKEVMGEGFTT